MTESLSPNAKAILLLTAPLIVGRGTPRDTVERPLSPKREYSELVRRLREIGREPADLIGVDALPVLDECLGPAGPRIDRHRIEFLLGRGVQLSLAVERWQARAIWVLSRADDGYPRRLKGLLREEAPPVLYGCGDRSFLDSGGLAVVGPRSANEDLKNYAYGVGALAARSCRSVISGAARGVDRAAMTGALDAGGWAVGVLANGLARAATTREHREALLGGKLVLVSPYDPAAGFVVGHAMERNHHIYALAVAALVVDALVGKGGTWAGAAAQLGRGSGSTVYVRSTLGDSEGLAALRARGALPWPNPQNPEEFGWALDRREIPAQVEQQRLVAVPAPSTLAEPRRLPFAPRSGDPREGLGGGDQRRTSADELWRAVRIAAWKLHREPREPEVAVSEFGLTGPQAKKWLGRLVDEGVLRREQRPVRYVASEFLREKGLGAESYRSISEATAGDELWRVIRDLVVRALGEPRSSVVVAVELHVMPTQAQAWLKRLAEEGALERRERPVRYVARSAGLLDGVRPLSDRD